MNNRYREEERLEEEQNQKNKKKEKTIEVKTKKEEKKAKKKEEEQAEDLEILELRAEVAKLSDLYLRTLAEAENFKKRINDERMRERKYASQSLLERLVNVTDIFDKAVNSNVDDEKVKNFLIGFQMINKNLQDLLEDEGVTKIKAKGEVFDPKVHHAVETVVDLEQDDNIIVQERQTGYYYKDRILRPSLVVVNKINENNKEEIENE
ncbi:MAG TPA: nucleotide exchange factor GrpE [Bacilli bacterium]|jgi:molecular chaperone GrpE|nr:nucleotide exchange factor GrpE [Acholeplasmataceae bacterium]HPA98837.1 nucleotide exchange factor GrpE [Bacilli bacterium]HPV55334.1 nucleotide exchange factor GrpE [Bacilli bacterium]HPX82890.1 nucleotide exchange factor GrpE [Bacilli bacterium]HQB79661.1 nucleotide exchange factor GrpE [Bacilli bacterium]